MTSASSIAPMLRPFGKYVLVRKIAEGGMAEIFLAKQLGAEGFERNVVIKRLLPQFSEAQDFVDLFLDEARLAARLVHPRVVQITELGCEEGCHYICMEYLAGEDFSTVLRTVGRAGRFVPLEVVVRAILDAADGLHFAHDSVDEQGHPLNVVHRDVSPSNLFLTYQGHLKVVDFGIARAESRVTRTGNGVVRGKYSYMAPEQAKGLSVDRRADVFSLGVCLYEALTNVRPFHRENELAVLNALLQSDYPKPRTLRPDLPEVFERITLKAMAFRPEDRYQTASELAQDLEQAMPGMSTPAGGRKVSAWLVETFGQERVTLRTRIPSLSMLRAHVDANAPVSASASSAALPVRPELPTRGGVRPAPIAQEPSRRSRRRALWLGGALIAGLTGAMGVWAMTGVDRPVEPPPAALPSQAVVVASPEPAPTRFEGLDLSAPTLPAPEASPEEPSAPEKAPVATARVERRRPRVDNGGPALDVRTAGFGAVSTEPEPSHPQVDKLTGPLIEDRLRAAKPSMLACFNGVTELPQREGSVVVRFRISGAGRVGGATVDGPLEGTAVGRCIERKVAAVRFPAHPDGTLPWDMSFDYRLK